MSYFDVIWTRKPLDLVISVYLIEKWVFGVLLGDLVPFKTFVYLNITIRVLHKTRIKLSKYNADFEYSDAVKIRLVQIKNFNRHLATQKNFLVKT